MSVIDKNMYEKLKKWCDWNRDVRPENQQIIYVNSQDKAVTKATIRKLMFDKRIADFGWELYISFYSAKNFYNNMRDYYTHVAELYFRKPSSDCHLVDIIKDLPSTCGWIILIVEDIEQISDDKEKMQELMESIMAFGTRHSSIILVGNGDYKDVLSKNTNVLDAITNGFPMLDEDEEEPFTFGVYDQEMSPIYESIMYENSQKQCDELNNYWHIIYEQLKRRYFDFEVFKALYKEVLEYIIPRISKERVYRKDLELIENIGAMRLESSENLEGCKPWEFDAAQQFSIGLHDAIINRYGDNDEITECTILIEVFISEPSEDYGCIHFRSEHNVYIELRADNSYNEIDRLSEDIHECTYKGKNIEDPLQEENNV